MPNISFDGVDLDCLLKYRSTGKQSECGDTIRRRYEAYYDLGVNTSHDRGDTMPDPLAHIQEQLRKDQKLLDTIKVHLPALEQLVEMLEYDYEDRMYRFYYQSFKVYELQSFTTQALDVFQQIAQAIDRPLSPWFTEIT